MARMGRYELLRPVGRGGMAEVFLARRRGPGGVEKQLVLKRIRPERVRDPRFLELFVREAELSMSLVHKNIVPVFDFGRADDELFLVMEQVDGFDLEALFRFARDRGTKLDPLLVAYIGLEACQGLDYAHRRTDASGPRAVFHRDVTPGNLLVSRDGEIKLVDFGVAARETDLGEAGKVRGTPAYMAPEQARGEAIDGRADVYALGLVMWEALAGTRARKGESKDEMLALARSGCIDPLPDRVPEALRDIIARATVAARDQRYASARDMQLALDEYLVAMRSADRGSAPPSHVLAQWLDDNAPSNAPAESPVGVTPSARKVVTFLDDGVDAVEGSEPSETMRSIAETMGETVGETLGDSAGDTAGDAAGDTAGTTAGDTAGKKASDTSAPAQGEHGARAIRAGFVALIAGSAVVAAAATAFFATRNGGSARQPRPSPTPVTVTAATHALDAGHAVALDAATPAVPVAAVPVDARDATDARAQRPSPRITSPERPPRPARRMDAAAPAAKPQSKPGTVNVSSSPWAQVSVEGSAARCADTPCTLTLPAGKHTLILRNPVSRVAKTIQVAVEAGGVIYVRETLTQRP